MTKIGDAIKEIEKNTIWIKNINYNQDSNLNYRIKIPKFVLRNLSIKKHILEHMLRNMYLVTSFKNDKNYVYGYD